MTDTNHIEVLHGFVEAAARDHNALSHDYVKDEKKCPRCKSLEQARAAITALSARASAGEGGDGQGEHAYNCGVNDAIVHDCSCGLTAAPQPAQAGAGGGVRIKTKGPDDFASHVCPAESSAVWNACVYEHNRIAEGLPPILSSTEVTPASPATGDWFADALTATGEAVPLNAELPGMWERADLIGGATDVAPQPQDERPASMYGLVNATPPAHGDGEGDYAAKWFAECRRVLEDVSTEMRATGRGDTRFRRLIESMPRQRTTRPTTEYVEGVCAAANALVRRLDEVHADLRYMAVWVTAQLHNGPYVGPKYDSELTALRAALTTRPTPEAQEARDGRPTMRELIDVLPGVYYMDPPDGGSVSLLEQLQRMAQDAARYRWLKSGGYEHADDGQPYAVVNRQDDYGNWRETIIEDDEADALIDAALALPAQGEG